MNPYTPMIDSHVHLDLLKPPLSLTSVIAEATVAGVERFIVPGIDESNWQHIQALSEQYPSVYYALGLHPVFQPQMSDDSLCILESLISNRTAKCVAIGECGLDFSIQNADRDKQITILEKHCEWANQHELPIILHCRKAHQEMIKVLRTNKPMFGGVIHGFTGSIQQALDYVQLGFYIGVGGSITYQRANKTRKTIQALPLSSLVLETDAPDMPMFGFQGTQNQPKYIEMVLEALIFLRKEDKQTVASIVHSNASKLFGLCG